MNAPITDNLDKEIDDALDERSAAEKQIEANIKWREGKRRFQIYIDKNKGLLLRHILVARNLSIAEWITPFIEAEAKALNISLPEPNKTQDS